MATASRCSHENVFWLVLPLLFCGSSNALIVEGELNTKEEWAFITRFCYKDNLGSVDYYFEYPKTLCCPKAVLYYDTQWPSVYPQLEMECRDKLSVTIPENNQILPLDVAQFYSGCTEKRIDDEDKIVCQGGRSFRSTRSRWWYIVISKCGSQMGIQMKYRLEMTNGNTFWTKHFSADEKNVLQPDIAFLCAYIVCLAFCAWIATILKSRQLFHYTYKLFMWSVVLESASLIFEIIYYVDYGQSGKPHRQHKLIGRGLHSTGDIVMLVMLVLLAKGWTVTRGKISASGQVKLGVFSTIYITAYIALFIYEAEAFDPGQVLYRYESPAGIGLCVLRGLAWLWFSYGTFFTLKHYPSKHPFYYPFWLFYTMWFMSSPVFVVIATYIISAWQRAQIMNGIERTTTFIAHIFFLVLTRPSAANTNFPYHVRTSQVGVLESKTDGNFEQHHYAPTYTATPEVLSLNDRSFTDISSMFNANRTANASQHEKQEKTHMSLVSNTASPKEQTNFKNFDVSK